MVHISFIAMLVNTFEGNDHYVTNTIVFSSKIGVAVYGAANILTGVHTWFAIMRCLETTR
jgi:hypothetical protein